VELHLLNFPLELFDRSVQHTAALQRELDVIRVDERNRDRPPDRLGQLVEQLDLRFVGYRAAMAMIEELAATEASHHDVVIPVGDGPEEVAPAIEQLRDLMDEVDAYCEQGGELLTPPTPPDLLAFRQWLFDQVIGQLRGAAPVPWEPRPLAHDAAPVAGASPGAGADGSDAMAVLRPSGDLDLANAGKVREEIYAVHTERSGDLRIDLTDVRFIDSVGISVLVAAHRRFQADGRALEIVVPAHLRSNFEITGLTAYFDIVPGEPR
jgi:anti-anti-sigma factor